MLNISPKKWRTNWRKLNWEEQVGGRAEGNIGFAIDVRQIAYCEGGKVPACMDKHMKSTQVYLDMDI